MFYISSDSLTWIGHGPAVNRRKAVIGVQIPIGAFCNNNLLLDKIRIFNMIFVNSLLVWLFLLIIWEAIWKGIALWKSGRNNQLKWFIVIFVFNTAGILPLIYLKFFQKKQRTRKRR